MKPARLAHESSNGMLPTAPAGEGPVRAWSRFWFAPTDPLAWHLVRICFGLLILLWLLPFAGYANSLFGQQGLFDNEARREAQNLGLTLGLRPSTLSLFYLSANPQWAVTVFWMSIGIVTLFTLGIWTRLTAILTWVVVVSFMNNPALDYDADALLLIMAFYLMVGHFLMGLTNPDQSLVSRLLGPTTLWPLSRSQNKLHQPSIGANVALRLLQVHFAIVLVTTGLHKLQFGEWWEGVALWYPLHPPMSTTADQVRSLAPHAESYFFFMSLATYAILAWEIGFPLFAWRRGMRLVLLAGGVLGCLGLAFVYDMPTFGPALLVGCLCFVTSEEWRAWWARLARLLGLATAAHQTEHAQGVERPGTSASLIPAGRR